MQELPHTRFLLLSSSSSSCFCRCSLNLNEHALHLIRLYRPPPTIKPNDVKRAMGWRGGAGWGLEVGGLARKALWVFFPHLSKHKRPLSAAEKNGDFLFPFTKNNNLPGEMKCSTCFWKVFHPRQCFKTSVKTPFCVCVVCKTAEGIWITSFSTFLR